MTTPDDDDTNWNSKRTHRFTVILEVDDAEKLLRAAHLRRVHPNKFASRLVQIITRDDLIDAVIDDGLIFGDGGRQHAAAE